MQESCPKFTGATLEGVVTDAAGLGERRRTASAGAPPPRPPPRSFLAERGRTAVVAMRFVESHAVGHATPPPKLGRAVSFCVNDVNLFVVS
jgi:hypothetical protein